MTDRKEAGTKIYRPNLIPLDRSLRNDILGRLDSWNTIPTIRRKMVKVVRGLEKAKHIMKQEESMSDEERKQFHRKLRKQQSQSLRRRYSFLKFFST